MDQPGQLPSVLPMQDILWDQGSTNCFATPISVALPASAHYYDAQAATAAFGSTFVPASGGSTTGTGIGRSQMGTIGSESTGSMDSGTGFRTATEIASTETDSGA